MSITMKEHTEQSHSGQWFFPDIFTTSSSNGKWFLMIDWKLHQFVRQTSQKLRNRELMVAVLHSLPLILFQANCTTATHQRRRS